MLELKSKTSNIQPLLDLEHGGHTVLAWSVNPPAAISAEDEEEHVAPASPEIITEKKEDEGDTSSKDAK